MCVYGILQTGCYAWISGCLFVFLSRSGDRLMLRWTKTTLYSQRRQLFNGPGPDNALCMPEIYSVCRRCYLISLVDVKAAKWNSHGPVSSRVFCSHVLRRMCSVLQTEVLWKRAIWLIVPESFVTKLNRKQSRNCTHTQWDLWHIEYVQSIHVSD